MPLPYTITADGMLHANRAAWAEVLRVGYVGMPFDRMRHVAERGDPEKHEYESPPGGIQPPLWAPALTAETSGGSIAAPADVTSRFYVCLTFSSSRYTTEDQGSNGSAVSTVTYTAVETDGRIKIDLTSFVEPPENAIGPDDYVDQIWFWRTTIDQTALTTGTTDPEIKGEFWYAGRTSIHSFRTYPVWTTSTAYTKGTYVQNVSGTVTTKYINVNPVVAGSTYYAGTFAQQLADVHWVAVGASPVYLSDSDQTVKSSGLQLSSRRGVPPDLWSLTVLKDGRLVGAGQRDYQIDIAVTNGSASFIVPSTAEDDPIKYVFSKLPTGAIGRSARVVGDGAEYKVEAWLSPTSGRFNKNYEGRTSAKVRALFEHTYGAVFGCHLRSDEIGLIATPLPDAWDFTPMLYREDVEAVQAAPEGLLVFCRHSVAWASNWGDPIRWIEDAETRTRGNANIAVGVGGSVFSMRSDGIVVNDSPRAARYISEPIRDLWEPRTNTTVAWNRQHLDRGFMIYHTRLRQLWAVGPYLNHAALLQGNAGASQINQAMAAVWDEAANAWQIYRFFIDVFGTLCQIDFNSGCMVMVNGQEELVLAGSIRVDTTSPGDSVLDAHCVGRFWQYGSRRFDDVPADKGGLIKDHGVVWQRSMTPLVAKDGAMVRVHDVTVFSEPITGGSVSGMGITLQEQRDPRSKETDPITLYLDLSKHTNRISVPPNEGRRMEVALFGTMNHTENDPRIMEIVVRGRTVGGGHHG